VEKFWEGHRLSIKAGDQAASTEKWRFVVEKTVEVIYSLRGRLQERM
jgi:hypothetical protein